MSALKKSDDDSAVGDNAAHPHGVDEELSVPRSLERALKILRRIVEEGRGVDSGPRAVGATFRSSETTT
jgi:hypothetical protein